MSPRLGMTGRLARWSATHHWVVFAAWLVGAVAILGLSTATGSRLTTDIEFSTEPDSQIARELLLDARGEEPYFEQIIVHSDTYTVDDPEFVEHAAALQAAIRGLDGVVEPEQSFSFFETGDPSLVSESRHTTLIPTLLVGELDEATEHVVPLEETLDEFTNDDFTVITGGYASVNQAFGEASESDLSTEFQVMPIAFIVLIIVIGAVVAAFLPILLAIIAIVLTTGLVAIMSQAYEMSIFVTNVMIMIGLAVGIDYALFVIARYREERQHGNERIAAIGVAGDTATRAVMFSGFTVVIALFGMFVVPTTIFRSFAIGASAVVLVTIIASATLLPAIISVLGDKINVLSIPGLGARAVAKDENTGFWAGTARFVMGNAPVMAIGTAALLIVMALPYFSINLGFSGTESLPESFEARQAFDILDEEFNAGRLQSTDIVVQADDINAAPVQDALGRLVAAIEGDPTYALINGVQILRDDLALVQIAVPGEAASDEAIDAMKHVRSDIVPASFDGVDADVYVGGPTAGNSDFFDVVDTYTPWVFAFVLGFSFVLLTLIFRSIVVPVKSIIMNLLSVGAAYGVIVAVFQWGWGADALGFTQVESIEAWLPLFMFTILFGLSMDYHIFLLSRIRERYDETHSNRESVAFGLRRTANIITGAAAIMVAVFAGFALGDLPMFQQIGVGLAVAVFLDATIVRTILVPATMRMLGDWNWYMPKWLHWLPDLRVEREPAPRIEAVPGGAPGGN